MRSIRLYPSRIALAMIDAGAAAFCAWLAFCIRLETLSLSPERVRALIPYALSLAAARLATFLAIGVYRIASRHIGLIDMKALGAGTIFSSAVAAAYTIAAHTKGFPRSAVIIEWMLSILVVTGVRVVVRVLMDERPRLRRAAATGKLRRILIVGAGARGAALAREIRRRAGEGLQLVGFVDDDAAKQRMLLCGGSVLGTTAEIRRLVQERDVDDVIISTSGMTGQQVRDLMLRCEDLPVRLRISPGFSELDLDGGLSALRDVSVEDLLRRKPVSVDRKEIAAYLKGERVLVTGAGGSIGSELVRQIAAVAPQEILLLGHGENSVFEIQQEMRREHGVTPTCIICDTRDRARLERIIRHHRPTVVFHAAAHKHVPLMEANPEEAITNNVLGTRNLVQLATMFGVKRLVMISTDKAVNPSSVMGATKRVAELIIQAESQVSDTEFATVRFGNVLGSRGSVVPTMLKQIQRGGPVTVTHPDTVRYFMLIPEAAQLVIQAGAMGGNNLYMLDMGEPVRIMDLARDVIRLSGRVPEKDVRIKIIGLRPGEKLFEELLTSEEGATVTRHERIFVAAPREIDSGELNVQVDALVHAAQRGNPAEALRLLKVVEPTFTGGLDATPAGHLQAIVRNA